MEIAGREKEGVSLRERGRRETATSAQSLSPTEVGCASPSPRFRFLLPPASKSLALPPLPMTVTPLTPTNFRSAASFSPLTPFFRSRAAKIRSAFSALAFLSCRLFCRCAFFCAGVRSAASIARAPPFGRAASVLVE